MYKLRSVGYNKPFVKLEDGVKDYVQNYRISLKKQIKLKSLQLKMICIYKVDFFSYYAHPTTFGVIKINSSRCSFVNWVD